MENFLLVLSQVADPLSINSMNLSNKEITSFQSLDKFAHLAELDMSKMKILALPNELSKLNHLKHLTCSFNNLKDSMPLPLNLVFLDLRNNDLNRLSFGRMPYLETLVISNNRIINIDSLSRLQALRYLYARSNCIESLSSLETINLLELDISENDIKSSDMLRPVLHSVCTISVNGNPFYRRNLINLPIFEGFELYDKGIYCRNVENLPKSNLIVISIPKLENQRLIGSNRNNSHSEMRQAQKELYEVRNLNIILTEKVQHLEDLCKTPNIETSGCKNRCKEIEDMAFEDWRSGLLRYISVKIMLYKKTNELKKVKSLNNQEFTHRVDNINKNAETCLKNQEFLQLRFQNLLNSLK